MFKIFQIGQKKHADYEERTFWDFAQTSTIYSKKFSFVFSENFGSLSMFDQYFY